MARSRSTSNNHKRIGSSAPPMLRVAWLTRHLTECHVGPDGHTPNSGEVILYLEALHDTMHRDQDLPA